VRRSTALQWQGEGDALPQWVGLGGSVEATAAGALVADLPSAALHLQAAPGQAAVAEVALVNAGVAALSLGAAVITGPGAAAFSLSGSGCNIALVLQPGVRCTARITAMAPAAGQRTALLQWRSDGAHLAPVVLAVAADGTAPLAPAPSPPAVPAPSPTPPPAPPAPPAPAPAPSPAPNPRPSPAAGASGGCAMAWLGQTLDPVLPTLLVLAWLALRRRVESAHRRGFVTPLAQSAPKVKE